MSVRGSPRVGNACAAVAFVALESMLSLASCGVAAALEENAAVPVRAVEIREAVLPEEVSGFGNLSFIMKADISAPGDGVVAEMLFREGDAVRNGDIVTRLVNPQAELAVNRARNGVAQASAALSLAEARLFEGGLAVESRLLGMEKALLELEQAKREFAESERKQADLETLFSAGGVPEESARSGRFSLGSARERLALMEKDIEIRMIGLRDEDLAASGAEPPRDQEERKRALVRLSVAALAAERAASAARLDAARGDLESALVSLSELTIAAPVSGVVAARYLETGERAKRGDKLLTIMDVGKLYAIASVSEVEAMRLKAGMKARVTVDGAAAFFDGTLDLVAPVADSGSASFSVKAIVRDPDRRLKPGMFARVSITTGPGRRVLVVPESAIADSSSRESILYLIVGGVITERRVKLGETIESGRIIESGASAGEVVVDGPDGALKEGDRVQISG